MAVYILKWAAILILAFLAGKLMTKFKMPSILGWLAVGILSGPHALELMPQNILDAGWYKIILMWMQCAFGLMLGSELVWNKLKRSGKALITTTLAQSLGTFTSVSLAFGILFAITKVPVYLAFVFGGIALATAPAPALSIINEFNAKGPVTSTLLPMAILDDVVGIVIFFTINSLVAGKVSGGTVPLYMIPVMIFLPVLIGVIVGFPVGLLLCKTEKKASILAILLSGITVTMMAGWLLNTRLLSNITLNYMLMGVSFSAVFSNMLTPVQLANASNYFSPVLGLALLTAIVDLGAPLDYHLILGAGLYTFIYIAARSFGKYFGARIGATLTHMPDTVCKYLGLTLLPHSGVSLVFTGIICSTLVSAPELVQIIQGTIAAAAIINEFIAVIAAKKGFELANEIQKP
ncbi:MAG: potassium transporter [Lachnospiraceae bacterium]|nr:potassium transporter [Lachnospiraceae bacterium]